MVLNIDQSKRWGTANALCLNECTRPKPYVTDGYRANTMKSISSVALNNTNDIDFFLYTHNLN